MEAIVIIYFCNLFITRALLLIFQSDKQIILWKKKIEYSFDDEPVSKFCYELERKKIKVHFKGYFDLLKDKYMEIPCIWTIENWKEAKCKVGDDAKLYDIDTSIGIFSLILYMNYNEYERLEMLINTVDNRYITLFFKDPNLSLDHKR